MAPIIEVSNKVLKGLDNLDIDYTIPKQGTNKEIISSEFNKDNFIYVPSLELYVAKERKLYSKNWFEAHKELQENRERMLIIPEFVEFLKYLKNSNNEEYLNIFDDITQVKSPWRGEWLDADFKVKNNKLHINSNHVLDSNGKIINYNSEPLDKNTLMKDKTPGISLEDWINNPTRQGLPNKKTKSGDLCYWYPRSDNNSVAGFDAGDGGANLICSWSGGPSLGDSDLGVRAVRHE